jgi:hypothetical protein
MASDPKLKVKVKLHARCLVDRQIREAGEEVFVEDAIADSFGVRVGSEKPGKPEKVEKPAGA